VEIEKSLGLCRVCWLGRMDYEKAWSLQKTLAEARADELIPDTLLLLEHPPTYTIGRRGREEHLLISQELLASQGIALYRVDRGGDITFHGPGQLVGYPVLSLKGRPGGPGKYLRSLEDVLIQGIGSFGVASGRVQGLTGVWIGSEKVAAIGVKINARRITEHGFALNVMTDIGYFSQIVPCGIQDKGVTTLSRVLGRPLTLTSVAKRVAAAFGNVFGMEMVEIDSTELLQPR
jgi:lipoyl(octanoyl) transferase